MNDDIFFDFEPITSYCSDNTFINNKKMDDFVLDAILETPLLLNSLEATDESPESSNSPVLTNLLVPQEEYIEFNKKFFTTEEYLQFAKEGKNFFKITNVLQKEYTLPLRIFEKHFIVNDHSIFSDECIGVIGSYRWKSIGLEYNPLLHNNKNNFILCNYEYLLFCKQHGIKICIPNSYYRHGYINLYSIGKVSNVVHANNLKIDVLVNTLKVSDHLWTSYGKWDAFYFVNNFKKIENNIKVANEILTNDYKYLMKVGNLKGRNNVHYTQNNLKVWIPLELLDVFYFTTQVVMEIPKESPKEKKKRRRKCTVERKKNNEKNNK